jgi:hypothetical protein
MTSQSGFLSIFCMVLRLEGKMHRVFGADYFYTQDFPDKSRHPFYFPLAENASKYPEIFGGLGWKSPCRAIGKTRLQNVLHFYQNLFS